MKKFVLIVSVAIAALAQTAQAGVPNILPIFPVVLQSELTSFEAGHAYLMGVNSGNLQVDLEGEVMFLELVEKVNCQPGMACIAIAPVRHQIELPIIKVEDIGCGSVAYTAELDRRPLDGPLETLVVVDHTNLKCRIFVRHQTEITYSTTLSGFSSNPVIGEIVPVESRFGGTQLTSFARPLF